MTPICFDTAPLDLDALEKRLPKTIADFTTALKYEWKSIDAEPILYCLNAIPALIAGLRSLEAEVSTARASYNALSEEVWKLHDAEPYLKDRIGRIFSSVVYRVKP